MTYQLFDLAIPFFLLDPIISLRFISRCIYSLRLTSRVRPPSRGGAKNYAVLSQSQAQLVTYQLSDVALLLLM